MRGKKRGVKKPTYRVKTNLGSHDENARERGLLFPTERLGGKTVSSLVLEGKRHLEAPFERGNLGLGGMWRATLTGGKRGPIAKSNVLAFKG